jgi:hypothetical protein
MRKAARAGDALRDQACIVGIGESAYCRAPGSGMTQLGLQLQASTARLGDAGLRPQHVDGVMPFRNSAAPRRWREPRASSELRFAATVNMGGAAPVASLRVAAAAVITGIATHVLLPAGWNGYSGRRARETAGDESDEHPGRRHRA